MRSSSFNDHTSPEVWKADFVFLILEVRKLTQRELKILPKVLWWTSDEIEVLCLNSVLAVSFLWCDLESSVPIHPCLISYLYSSAFPKVTVNEQKDDQNDIYMYFILSAEDIKHERPGAKVWKAAAWVISCSGEIVGAQTVLLHDLGILDGFSLVSISHWGFFFFFFITGAFGLDRSYMGKSLKGMV